MNSDVPVLIIFNVTKRLTALLAAILMGAPACLTCPMMAAEQADAAAHHSCCCEAQSKETSTPASKPDSGKPCPCEMSQAPRDFAVDMAVAPTPDASLDYLLPSPSETRFAWVILMRDRGEVFNDTGPPPPERPLFQQHHTWLL